MPKYIPNQELVAAKIPPIDADWDMIQQFALTFDGNDQKRDLDAAQVYTPEQVEQFVALFLAGGEPDKLDPNLDACVAVYNDTLDEDQQVDFKGKPESVS